MKRGSKEDTYIYVELPHETGEVAVLEEFGEKIAGEDGDIPDDETIAGLGPRDDVIVHHVVTFSKKGGYGDAGSFLRRFHHHFASLRQRLVGKWN